MILISNGQNGSSGELFAKDNWQKPKNNQLAAITLLKDKVDINKKITKNDIVKVCNILSRFLITINFESSKAVCVEYRIEILKSLLRNPSTNKLIICCFIDGKTARINPAPNEISI
jgi:hypothetical protein